VIVSGLTCGFLLARLTHAKGSELVRDTVSFGAGFTILQGLLLLFSLRTFAHG
jgi:hypothetical protein